MVMREDRIGARKTRIKIRSRTNVSAGVKKPWVKTREYKCRKWKREGREQYTHIRKLRKEQRQWRKGFSRDPTTTRNELNPLKKESRPNTPPHPAETRSVEVIHIPTFTSSAVTHAITITLSPFNTRLMQCQRNKHPWVPTMQGIRP